MQINALYESNTPAHNRLVIRTNLLAALVFLTSPACTRSTTMTRTHDDRTLTEHSDRLQILDHTARFADCANRHDWDSMALLFDENAIWETAAGGLGFRHEGRPAIQRFLLDNPNGVDVLAYAASMPVIELTALDRARSRLHITELLRLRATGETKRIFGTYEDELVKRDGRWYFAHRRFTMQGAIDELSAAARESRR